MSSEVVSRPRARVLLVDEEDALLFALSEYLSFRGCRVDCARGFDDASALVHHLRYDAVLVTVRDGNAWAAELFSRAVHAVHADTRTFAVPVAEPTAAPARPSTYSLQPSDFDERVESHRPLALLARKLCHCVAA